MVGHRRAAALAAALLIVFMVPAMAPQGVARAAAPYQLTGTVLGQSGGSTFPLVGATVACAGPCTPVFTNASGNFSLSVTDGTWFVSVTPNALGFESGWYSLGSSGNFSTVGGTPVVPVADTSLGVIIVPGSSPTVGSISGTVVGASYGSLQGGTVEACTAWSSCAFDTIDANGAYWIDTPVAGTYTLTISPPSGSGYPFGYYSVGSAGNFSTNVSFATSFSVGSTPVGLPLITLSGYSPGSGSISGTVVGANSASLAGGTVTACPSASWWWTCASATIAWNGSYWIGSLPSGTYVVSITPPTSSFLSGWYSNWTSGNFTTSASSATAVSVSNTNVWLPLIVVPGYAPVPTWGTISGTVVGANSGSLAGGTVQACTAGYSCITATIGSTGSFWFGTLVAGTYTLSIIPTTASGYPSGYYAAGAVGNFTTNVASATAFSVWNTNIVLPQITVPGTGTGGIVIVTPQAYVVWAYLRPEFSNGTGTSLRIAQGDRAELASMIDPKLAGMRVDVWRRLAGQDWVLITTRGISTEGWVIYRFTATGGTNGAQFRFHLPSTSLTLSVWSVARTVRLL
jgi:hypothetical protein